MDFNTKILIAIEGFMRNASYIDGPFMAKGSIITRQFFPNTNMRYVQDLDWVSLDYIDNVALAGTIFSKWVIQITESNQDENVWFKNFKDNNFWRMIDYAMDDDFPTTNTDLFCIVNKNGFDIGLDISFNLDIDFPPEELIYKPLLGKPFKLNKVVPYCLQVSWKLHQLLVRPRLKDIFDLIFLLRHEQFNKNELEKIVYALKKECKRDGINIERLTKYIDGPNSVKKEEKRNIFNSIFGVNSFQKKQGDLDLFSEKDYTHFTSKEYFPYENYSAILSIFQKELTNTGFTKKMISQ